MSTQINVTVGSGGLPEKAKQQQQAARQAQLEKERQRRIEAQGQQQRIAALAADGRASDGSVLSGGNAKQPLPQPRPAAFRASRVNYGWFRLILEPITLRTPSFTQTGLGFPVFYSGQADSIRIESVNGASLIDNDYAEASLIYPPTYPLPGIIVTNSYAQWSPFLLPVADDQVVLSLAYKQTVIYNYVLRNESGVYIGTQTESEFKTYSKAYLISPDSIKLLTVPAQLESLGLDYAEPATETYTRFLTGIGTVTLYRPVPPNQAFQDQWLNRRRQTIAALTQYGTTLSNVQADENGTTYTVYNGAEAAGNSNPFYDVSCAGPGVYSFFPNEANIKAIIQAAYDAGQLGTFSFYERSVIKSYPWLEQFVLAKLKAKKVYGLDRDWTDLSQIKLDLFEIPTPTRGSWDEDKFDGVLNSADYGYPPRKFTKKEFFKLPISYAALNTETQLQMPTVYYFTTLGNASYCRAQALALGFTTADLTP
jgi:hypothetical protein